MKSNLILIILTCLSMCLEGQDSCDPELESTSVISNSYRESNISSVAQLQFNDGRQSGFFVGDGSEETLFELGFARGITVGGYDPAGNLKVAASGYGQGNDYIPGPIWTNFNDQPALCEFYKRAWVINQDEVLLMNSRFENGELQLSDIPIDILEWPALSNPNLGAFAPTEQMAPFFDLNQDGRYDPLEGDYPIPMSESPDFVPSAFRFMVFNDDVNHQQSRGAPLKMEFHLIDFITECVTEAESQTSVFSRLKYIYKGLEDLREFRIGIWDDTDLGCYTNDYVGCNPDLNAFFVYNAGGDDPLLCDGGVQGIPEEYGAVRSLVFLDKKLESLMVNYNGGVGNPPSNQIDPSSALEYYNYLDLKWRDGTPLTKGGNGLNPGSTDFTSYAFDGLPTDLNGWSMQIENAALNDSRAVAVFQSEELLQPGAINTVDFVDHVLLSSFKDDLNIFELYEESILRLKGEHEQMRAGTFDCGLFPEPCQADCVWPGDVDNDGHVTGKDLVIIGTYLGMGETTGSPREVSSSSWYPFDSQNWNEDLFGYNAKYADVDGNGLIEFADLLKGDENLGLSRSENYPNVLLEEKNEGNVLSTWILGVDSIDVETQTSIFQRVINFRSDITILEPIHGLSYEVRIDTNIVGFNRENLSPSDLFFENAGAYTDVEEVDFEFYFGDNKSLLYYTNSNGQNIEDFTRLATVPLIIREDAKTNNPNRRDTLVVKYYNAFATNAAGEEVQLGANYHEVILKNLIYDPDLVSDTKELIRNDKLFFSLSPNPVYSSLTLDFQKPASGNLKFYSMDGVLLDQMDIPDQETIDYDVSAYPVGIYLSSFTDESGLTKSVKFIKK